MSISGGSRWNISFQRMKNGLVPGSNWERLATIVHNSRWRVRHHRLDSILHRRSRRVLLAGSKDFSVGRFQNEVRLVVIRGPAIEPCVIRRVTPYRLDPFMSARFG